MRSSPRSRKRASGRSAPIRAASDRARNIRRTPSGCRRTYFSSENQLQTLALGNQPRSQDVRICASRRDCRRCCISASIPTAPLIALGRAGLLRPRHEYIHCTHLNEEAWRWIKDSGGTYLALPTALEMAMALRDAGNPGRARPRPCARVLSSDHTATVAQDMFGIMRTGVRRAAAVHPPARAARRAEPAAAAHLRARCSNSPPSRARAAPDFR